MSIGDDIANAVTDPLTTRERIQGGAILAVVFGCVALGSVVADPPPRVFVPSAEACVAINYQSLPWADPIATACEAAAEHCYASGSLEAECQGNGFEVKL